MVSFEKILQKFQLMDEYLDLLTEIGRTPPNRRLTTSYRQFVVVIE